MVGKPYLIEMHENDVFKIYFRSRDVWTGEEHRTFIARPEGFDGVEKAIEKLEIDDDAIEWRVIKEKVKAPNKRNRSRPRDRVEIFKSRLEGVDTGVRHGCVATACARAIAPDPDNNEQVAVLVKRVIQRFPRKPRRRGSLGWTPNGAYYGGIDHALRSLGVAAFMNFVKENPTVGTFIDELRDKYNARWRTCVSVRRHVGFIHGENVYDLGLRKHVKSVTVVDDSQIPAWAYEAVK